MEMFDHKEFIVDQRLLSIRNTYVVKNKLGEQLGFIKQEFISLGPKFWFEDNASIRLGEVDGKVLTVRQEYEIKDKDGNHQVLHKAGEDVTAALQQAPHREDVLKKFPVIGTLRNTRKPIVPLKHLRK
jgi:predicted heme/steroid binding protein